MPIVTIYMWQYMAIYGNLGHIFVVIFMPTMATVLVCKFLLKGSQTAYLWDFLISIITVRFTEALEMDDFAFA